MKNLDLTPDTITIVVRLDDGSNQVDYPLSYQLGPNRAPQVTGSRVLASASMFTPAVFTMNAGTGTAYDWEGDALSYTITNNRNANQVTFTSFPNAANSTAITNPPYSSVNFTIYANDPLHPTTAGTVYPNVPGMIGVPGSGLGWARKPPGATQSEQSYGVTTSGTDVLLLGEFFGTQNFGGGNRTSNGFADIFVVKYDVNGSYLWDYTVGSTADEYLTDVVTDDSGNVWISLHMTTPINFGGGLRTPFRRHLDRWLGRN